MALINWNDFEKVDLRVGKIIHVKDFPEARKPAFQLWIDFGQAIGIKKSSAQITDLYTKEELIGKLVVAVINFPVKQIGSFMSECLVTGFANENGHIVLTAPDKKLPLGVKLM